VWLAALAFVIAGVMLRYHRLGRALYAIGGNPEAARAAGIRVERITWGVYVLAGMLAALGGLAITGYVGAISANQGNGLIFTVFAAAVIGGISLDGGKGTMFGALTGVLLLGGRRQSPDARASAVVLDLGDLWRDHPRIFDGRSLRGRPLAGIGARANR
jgi:simple sugar transport system permease protein